MRPLRLAALCILVVAGGLRVAAQDTSALADSVNNAVAGGVDAEMPPASEPDTRAADTFVAAFAYDTSDTTPDTLSLPDQSAPVVMPAEVKRPRAAWRPGEFLAPVLRIWPIGWLYRHAVQILLLLLSAWGLWSALSYLADRADRERFLSRDRLSLMDKEVQKACLVIEKQFAEPELTHQRVCEILETGESFLEALFARELGMSVSAYIEHVRINRAIHMLRANHLEPVSELAGRAGLTSAEALSEPFERITGLSIERYRDALSSGEDPLA